MSNATATRTGTTVTVLRPRPRLEPAPNSEPPFDVPGAGVRSSASSSIQGTLALTFTLPSGVPATPAAWLRLVPPPAPDPQPTSPAGPPLADPQVWAARLAQAVAEVLAGERPARQLLHWTTPEIYSKLARRAVLAAGSSAAQRSATSHIVLRRIHVQTPADGIVEATTVIHGARRSRALTFRLEARDGRWLCTVLELL